MSRTTDSSRSGSGSEAPPPLPLSDLATKLETKLKKQDTANKLVFARKLKEEEVRHFHPMADIIAERLISPKLLSEVRPIFHDFMLLRLSLRRMDKMLAAVGRQTRRITKAVTRRRKIARSYVQQVAPSSPSASSAPSASSLASGPQPVALSARQTRFLALKKEQVSQLETRLSAFIGSHPADTLSRPFKQYLHWQMGELANARKKIDAYGKDRGTQSDGGKGSKPLSGTETSPLSASKQSAIASTPSTSPPGSQSNSQNGAGTGQTHHTVNRVFPPPLHTGGVRRNAPSNVTPPKTDADIQKNKEDFLKKQEAAKKKKELSQNKKKELSQKKKKELSQRKQETPQSNKTPQNPASVKVVETQVVGTKGRPEDVSRGRK